MISQVVWRRDFIKFPASHFPGWPAGEGRALYMGRGGGQRLALTVAGSGGPICEWGLRDGKRGGAQKLHC